jgi:SAM-dependent methyltransferase
MSTEIKSCRSCTEKELTPILSLGRTPLANSLRTAEQLNEPEPTYPLELVFCPRCTLVQITETVPPEELFRQYLYFSSFSETMLRHAREIAEKMVAARGLGAKHLVIEVASNDGYLLQYYKSAGVQVLGIEPAVNIAQVAETERGIPTIQEFFDAELAARLRSEGRRADVIHANNVLAHVADVNGFVSSLSLLLTEDGTVVVEVPYVKDLLEGCEFDTIYHEHLCYFSLTALSKLFSRHGLAVIDVERLKIHGGSLRVFAEKEAGARRGPSGSVKELLQAEAEWGVGDPGRYLDFRDQVEHLRERLLAVLGDLREKGHSLAAYGASAKGTTLLNYFRIGKETLDFVVDRSTVKQGLYTPGTHLPIHAPEKLLEALPDYVLLLTWNFADEILAQQREFRERGGRFIIPIPEVRVV